MPQISTQDLVIVLLMTHAFFGWSLGVFGVRMKFSGGWVMLAVVALSFCQLSTVWLLRAPVDPWETVVPEMVTTQLTGFAAFIVFGVWGGMLVRSRVKKTTEAQPTSAAEAPASLSVES